MSRDISTKFEELKKSIRQMESAVIAFSGGVDSTFLLKVAHDEIGSNLLAVTASSSTYPLREEEEAKSLAHEIGVDHTIIHSEELDIPGFSNNTTDRCYYCKGELFGLLKDMAAKQKFNYVLDGANFDDTSDFRPGSRAASELGVRSPLKEAGLTKEEIRELSRDLGLPTWDKPAFACLASRFPYGETITGEKLSRVEKAEELLRDLGFKQVRVRHHNTIARIEVPAEEINTIIGNDIREKITKKFKELGFIYTTVDLKGYRTGSMNETIAA